MTREEATIQALRNHIEVLEEQLRKQHCENAISKEEVLDVIYTFHIDKGNPDFVDFVTELPSVTPTRKKGKWIYNEKESDLDYYVYNCSICGRQINFLYDSRQIKNYPFCHCGAEMESEE